MPLVGEGDIFLVDVPRVGPHPVIVISDQSLIELSTEVVVALVTTRIRGYRTEVPIHGHGLHHSVVRCDNLFTIRRSELRDRQSTLHFEELAEVRRCVGVALGIT